MKLGAILGWGIVIYAIVFLTWSALSVYGWTSGIAPRALELCVLALVCVVAGRSLRMRNWKDILPYSILWAVIAAILDAVFALPLQSWALYGEWGVWIGYVLVALLPLFAVHFRHNPSPDRTWET